MGKFLLFLFAFFVLITAVFTPPVSAQRYARCDACGFCDPNQIQPQALDGLGAELAGKQPGDIASCHKCLYPGVASPTSSKGTLLIDETIDSESGPVAPTPAAGKYYTMFGCIDTKVGGFTTTGAGGAVVQTLLNRIFAAVGGIAFITVLFGAYVILTSRADPARLNYGRRVVVGAIVGLIFTLASVFIINLVGGNILGLPGL